MEIERKRKPDGAKQQPKKEINKRDRERERETERERERETEMGS